MKNILYYSIKSISIALTAALVVVCVFSGYLLYCSMAGMDVPALGPFKMYAVLSESMAPAMRTNDAIIVRETDAANLNVGDVITFHAFQSDTIITHRITNKSQTPDGYEFNTKGDNNNVADLFVTPGDRVIGRHVTRIPQFGAFVIRMEESPYTIVAPVAIIIAVQFLFGVFENKLKPDSKKREPSQKDLNMQELVRIINKYKDRSEITNAPDEVGV